MQLPQYRFADYRLAAYVVVGAVIAGGVVFALDRAFAPSEKIQANGAPASAVAAAQSSASGAVRQIPIAKTNAADLGDPEGKLTPVYPAAPGKDMPMKDAPVVQAKPAAPTVAATTGTANATAPLAMPTPAPVATAPAAAPAPVASATPVVSAPPVANAPPMQNACNVEACAASYRSFRESDCSYQPLSGARRYCEGAPGAAAGEQVAVQPPVQSQPQARPQFDQRNAASQPRRYEDSLRDAERAVRRLPPPGQQFDDDDDDSRVVMEAPEQRYDLRRNWVSEPQE